jgi:hypothetical protein
LTRERQGYDDNDASFDGKNAASVLAAETLRRGAERPPASTDTAKGEERISLFWRVFGGTILSIAALVVITVYNQFSSTLTDLRKEMNQLYENRAELLRKDEFNNRLTSVWNSMKELQTANQNLVALNERAKLVDQQLERQIKNADEDRKELCRRLEELRKAGEEERKEMHRKLEEQRTAFDADRKELARQVQHLSERLASVEGRKAGKAAGPAAPQD